MERCDSIRLEAIRRCGKLSRSFGSRSKLFSELLPFGVSRSFFFNLMNGRSKNPHVKNLDHLLDVLDQLERKVDSGNA